MVKAETDSWEQFTRSIPFEDLNISTPAHFKHKVYMDGVLQGFMDITSEGVLTKQKLIWVRMTKCLAEMESNLKKNTNELAKHVTLLKAAHDKSMKRNIDAQEKEVLNKQMADLKERASNLKHGKTSPVLQAVFQLKPEDCIAIELIDAAAFAVDMNIDMPLKLINSKHVIDWLANPVMQQVMAAFGGKYKKTKGFDVDRKTNTPLAAKTGGEQTEAMFKEILRAMSGKLMDISVVSTSWGTTSWTIGLDPTYRNISMCPNSSALLRVMSLGDVEVYAVGLLALKKGIASINRTFSNMEELTKLLSELSSTVWSEMVDKHKMPIYHAIFAKEELMYLPAGWVLMERCRSGPLVYGVRKSIFLQSPAAKDNYCFAKEMLAAAGTNTRKMDMVSDAFDS
jgi:hypothetical protein